MWSVSAGSLPAGLILNQSGPLGGTISGTPLSGGSFNFTVRITDSVGQTDTQDLSINVTPLSITTTSLPPGSIGQAYSQQVQTIGGIAPLTWSISAGTLPPGLNLNQTTGVISGTPIVPAGTSSFTVRGARRRRTSGHASALDRHQPIQRAKYHDHHAPGSNSRSVLQSDVTGKWRNWGTYLECPSRIASSGSHALSGRNHFRHSNQCRNLQLYSDGQRHIESARHAGSLDCRERAPGNHDNVATSCPRRARLTAATLQSSGGVPPASWSVDQPLPGGLGLNASTGSELPAPQREGRQQTQGTSSLTFTAQDSFTPTPQTANQQLGLTIAPP